jgi:hypothetical protein
MIVNSCCALNTHPAHSLQEEERSLDHKVHELISFCRVFAGNYWDSARSEVSSESGSVCEFEMTASRRRNPSNQPPNPTLMSHHGPPPPLRPLVTPMNSYPPTSATENGVVHFQTWSSPQVQPQHHPQHNPFVGQQQLNSAQYNHQVQVQNPPRGSQQGYYGLGGQGQHQATWQGQQEEELAQMRRYHQQRILQHHEMSVQSQLRTNPPPRPAPTPPREEEVAQESEEESSKETKKRERHESSSNVVCNGGQNNNNNNNRKKLHGDIFNFDFVDKLKSGATTDKGYISSEDSEDVKPTDLSLPRTPAVDVEVRPVAKSEPASPNLVTEDKGEFVFLTIFLLNSCSCHKEGEEINHFYF